MKRTGSNLFRNLLLTQNLFKSFYLSRSLTLTKFNILRSRTPSLFLSSTHTYHSTRSFLDEIDSSSSSIDPTSVDRSRSVYVGALAPSVTDSDLASFFADNPGFVQARVMLNQYTGLSRRFGFAEFDTVENAMAALKSKEDNNVLLGSKVIVDKAEEKQDFTKGGRKLYMGNVAWDATKQDIEKALTEQFGEIMQLVLPINKETGKLRGFGFVVFADKEAADKAIAAQKIDINGRTAFVSIINPPKPREKGRRRESKNEEFNLSF